MSILRIILEMTASWSAQELERFVVCLKEDKSEDDLFTDEVIDEIERELQKRQDAERVLHS